GLGLRHLPEPVGLPDRTAARAVLLGLPPAVPRRVPELLAGPRMAGPAGPAAKPGRRSGGGRPFNVGRTDRVARLPAGRAALADRHENRACPGGRLGAARA